MSGKCLENSLLKKLQKISRQGFTCIHIIFFITWLCLAYVRPFLLIVFFEHAPNHLSTEFYSTPKRHKFTNIMNGSIVRSWTLIYGSKQGLTTLHSGAKYVKQTKTENPRTEWHWFCQEACRGWHGQKKIWCYKRRNQTSSSHQVVNQL